MDVVCCSIRGDGVIVIPLASIVQQFRVYGPTLVQALCGSGSIIFNFDSQMVKKLKQLSSLALLVS